MSTILFSSPVFGPVHSRRLGISLGINLMPADGKICTFDCIYCECGFNKDGRTHTRRPDRSEVKETLQRKLEQMREKNELPDVLTFAGNGEPCAHPEFKDIIEDTIKLRDEYCPEAKVSVLTNSTFIHKDKVRQALMLVDNNILKLDTVNKDYIMAVDRPTSGTIDIKAVIDEMKKFQGHCIIQTMFMGSPYDNTGEEYVLPWLKAVKEVAPSQVMIYTIDRETPDHSLAKASKEKLDAIARQVENSGFRCSVSY